MPDDAEHIADPQSAYDFFVNAEVARRKDTLIQKNQMQDPVSSAPIEATPKITAIHTQREVSAMGLSSNDDVAKGGPSVLPNGDIDSSSTEITKDIHGQDAEADDDSNAIMEGSSDLTGVRPGSLPHVSNSQHETDVPTTSRTSVLPPSSPLFSPTLPSPQGCKTFVSKIIIFKDPFANPF